MRALSVIESPHDFIVVDYEPGLLIDFSNPAGGTDLDIARQNVSWSQLSSLTTPDLLEETGRILVSLGLASSPNDVRDSLVEFFAETDSERLILRCREFVSMPSDQFLASDVLRKLFELTGVIARPQHYPSRLYCHIPGELTRLEDRATHFGFVYGDEICSIELPSGRTYPLYPQSVFSLPGPGTISGSGKVEVLTRFEQTGMFSIGAPIENWGRLRYIDGCTDTLLIPPVRRGDACLNALYFPPNIQQTQHTHPSIRAGMVVGGRGMCKTPKVEHELSPGKIFFLPPDTWHAFWTFQATSNDPSALTVIAYHPDSDFGPTDEEHPMLNRTYFEFLHRLRSCARQNAKGVC